MTTYGSLGNNFQFLTTMVATFIGDNFLGGNFQWGDFQRGEISEKGNFIGRYFHKGAIFIGGNFLGGNFSGGNFLGGNFHGAVKMIDVQNMM